MARVVLCAGSILSFQKSREAFRCGFAARKFSFSSVCPSDRGGPFLSCEKKGSKDSPRLRFWNPFLETVPEHITESY